MYWVLVSVFVPWAFVTVKVTVQLPGWKQVVEGFCKVAVAPLPKSQNQLVITTGEHPVVRDAVKLAVCENEIAIQKKETSVRVVFRIKILAFKSL